LSVQVFHIRRKPEGLWVIAEKETHPAVNLVKLNSRRIARRKQDADLVGGLDVNLFGREQIVDQNVTWRSVVGRLDAVGHGDGHVENGVVLFVVEAEALPDGDLRDKTF
jgi:hypothetical protein